MKERIEELEIRLALMEQTLEELNQVIINQDKILLQQEQQLKLLYQRIKNLPTNSEINLPHEEPLPPHY